MKRVIELIRVSTKAQAGEDRASIPAQRAVNRRTAQSFALEIVRSIEFADVSGAAVLMAPEMQELLKLIADPHVHGVVTKEFSRLMRPENFSDYAMLQAFVDTKTILYLPDGPVDFSSKSGRLLGGIRALMAGNEISEMRERAWDAKEQKRQQGKCPSNEICLPSDVGYDESRGWYYKPEAEVTREAFRLFLSGVTSYHAIGKSLGINPYTIRKKLRNPIYCGWRVIDEKRDPSAAARRVRFDGRQGDRPKIKRAPEEIIRVKVIDNPLVSEVDFRRVQAIMDAKRVRHWRTRPDYQHKYTYNGFMICAECGDLIYTHCRRADYYVCKARKLKGECLTSYMRRDRLDPALDLVFSKRLTDKGFLREVASEAKRRAECSEEKRKAVRLAADLESLRGRRDRVLDSYFDGTIDKVKRDLELAKIDREVQIAEGILRGQRPEASLSADSLARLFSTFYEFEYLGRDDKRRLLATLAPEIKVANYRVDGISLMLPEPRGYNVTPTGTGSSRPRA